MTYQAVVPSVHPPYTDALLDTMGAFDPERVLVVDNTETNRGVAASWNLGVDAMRDRGADWLVLLSAGLRFAEPWGADLLDALDANPGAVAVEAGWGVGWHAIALHRRAFDAVGRFDENYWPGWFEEIDFSRRLMLAGLTADRDRDFWPKVTVECYVRCFAHSQRFAGITADADRLLAYHRSKWGGPPGAETFAQPFGRAPLHWWPDTDPAAR